MMSSQESDRLTATQPDSGDASSDSDVSAWGHLLALKPRYQNVALVKVEQFQSVVNFVRAKSRKNVYV
jgi:hypothetical protein